MKSLLAIAASMLLLGCTATAQSTPDVQGTVSAAVAATVTALVPPTAMPSSTAVPDLAQSRNGAALSVWASPEAAYFALFPQLANRPECTIPPFTDVQVIERDVGFAFTALSKADQSTIRALTFTTGQPSDIVGRVTSLDGGRCTGYVAATLLTTPR